MELNRYCEHLYGDDLDGYLHVAHLDKDRRILVYNTRNKNIKNIVESIDSNLDIYVTPNTTYLPVRQAKNIRQFRALFIDLDICELGYGKAETVYMVWDLVNDGKIPKPTMVVDSGRGVHLYWRIEHAPFGAWYTWQELEDYLYYNLRSLGADKKATDSVRILRVPTTVNSKNDCECKVIYIDDDLTYSMYKLREEYLNYKPSSQQLEIFDTKPEKSKKIISNKFFNSYSLHLNRALDVEDLCRFRKYDMKGCRNAVLHCYAYWTGITLRDDEDLASAVHSLNNAFLEPLKRSEVEAIIRCVPKAIDKFIEYEQGIRSGERKRVTKGMRDKGGYWYKNETLIDLFQISREEEKKLKLRTIISTEEKYDRNNNRRREKRRNENGLTSREQSKEDLISKVKELKSQGLKQKEVAEKLNKSLRTIKGYWNK